MSSSFSHTRSDVSKNPVMSGPLRQVEVEHGPRSKKRPGFGKRALRTLARLGMTSSVGFADTGSAEKSEFSRSRDSGAAFAANTRVAVEFEYYFFWSSLTQSIRFYALDRGTRIRCGITRTALQELVNAPEVLQPADLERVFEQHRHDVEAIAADKIVARQFQPDGTIVVRAVDLNP